MWVIFAIAHRLQSPHAIMQFFKSIGVPTSGEFRSVNLPDTERKALTARAVADAYKAIIQSWLFCASYTGQLPQMSKVAVEFEIAREKDGGGFEWADQTAAKLVSTIESMAQTAPHAITQHVDLLELMGACKVWASNLLGRYEIRNFLQHVAYVFCKLRPDDFNSMSFDAYLQHLAWGWCPKQFACKTMERVWTMSGVDPVRLPMWWDQANGLDEVAAKAWWVGCGA